MNFYSDTCRNVFFIYPLNLIFNEKIISLYSRILFDVHRKPDKIS
mgnify:CR=1 FL=1